jgi:hypothetical protein
MKVFQISKGKPEGTMSEDDQKKFEEANTIFVGCILSILALALACTRPLTR